MGSSATALSFAAVCLTGLAMGRAARGGGGSRARARLIAIIRSGEPAKDGSESYGRSPIWFSTMLDAAGFGRFDPLMCWRAWTLGAVGTAGLACLLLGAAAGALVAMGCAAAPPAVLWSLRDRGATRYEGQLPGLLDDVAAGLRSGSSMLTALTHAGRRAPVEVGGDVAWVVGAVARGAAFGTELDRWELRRRGPAVRLTTAAIAVGLTTGGRQARAIEMVAATLRERGSVQREAVALATQSRASAAVMVVIPLVFAVAAAMLDPDVGAVLLRTPLGQGCLAVGLLLDGAAAMWMARISRVSR